MHLSYIAVIKTFLLVLAQGAFQWLGSSIWSYLENKCLYSF